MVRQQLILMGKHGALMTEDNLASVTVPLLSYLFPCLICMCSAVFRFSYLKNVTYRTAGSPSDSSLICFIFIYVAIVNRKTESSLEFQRHSLHSGLCPQIF